MKRILNSPIYYLPKNYFTGDNVAHFFPAKYLWHVCNVTGAGFHQPVYDFSLNEEVEITFLFYPDQPQHKYFKRPPWIKEFIVAKDENEANYLARQYDFFINNYRYRGAYPQEVNWGYSQELKEINLYVPAYTHKSVYDEKLYIDDLELSDKYADFLTKVKSEINPEGMPVIVLHQRGSDPWGRHLPDSIKRYEELLFNLLSNYPDHMFVLVGESWIFYNHPRVKYLEDYINRSNLKRNLNEYSACLKYILAAFYCRDAELVFIGISGFTLFIESIRPTSFKPPIPIFWGPETYSGVDTCIKKFQHTSGWRCEEFERYKIEHPEDEAFQHEVHHFLYYSRDENVLKPYCWDYPNDIEKIFTVIKRLEEKYEGQKKDSFVKFPAELNIQKYKDINTLKSFVNCFKWQYKRIRSRILETELGKYEMKLIKHMQVMKKSCEKGDKDGRN